MSEMVVHVEKRDSVSLCIKIFLDWSVIPLHCGLEDFLVVVRSHFLQMRFDLAVVSAHVLRIPPITSSIVVGKGGFQSFQGQIRRAHDCLPHVIKAMDHMPVVVFGEFRVRCEA